MKLLISIICWTMALSYGAHAQDAPASLPTAVARTYEAYSNNTDYLLGTMHLSTTFVSFSVLEGSMDIEFVGKAPDPEKLSKTDADIYRVRNPDQFFQLNKGRNGFCHEPIRWFGIVPLGSNSIVRIFFYTISDYREYRPDSLGLCSADSYQINK